MFIFLNIILKTHQSCNWSIIYDRGFTYISRVPYWLRWRRTSSWRIIYGFPFSKWSIAMPQECWSQSLFDHHHPIHLLCILVKIDQHLSDMCFQVYVIWIHETGKTSGVQWQSECDASSRCKNHLWIAEWIVAQWSGNPLWCIGTLASRYFIHLISLFWPAHLLVVLDIFSLVKLTPDLMMRTMLWNFASSWWTIRVIGSISRSCSTSERTPPRRRPNPGARTCDGLCIHMAP